MTGRSGGYVASVVGVLGTRLLGALASIMVARLLGPEDRGTYGLLVFGVALAAVLASTGIEVWIARTVAAVSISVDDVRAIARHHLRVSCTVIGGVAAVMAFAGIGFTPGQFVLAGWMSATMAWSMLRLAFLGGSQRMRRVAASQVAGSSVYVLGTVALLLTSTESVVAVMAIAGLSTATLAIWTGVSLSSPIAVDPERLRSARRFGRPAMAGELLSQLTYRTDLVVIAVLSGPRPVGLYVVAAALSELLWVIPNGVSQLLLPRVAAESDPEATRAAVVVTTLLGLAGAIVLGVTAQDLVSLAFGSEFQSAAGAVPWLSGAAVAFGLWKILVADLAARGNTVARFQTSAVSFVTMITLDVPLVATHGLVGAAIASLIAYSTAALLALRTWSRMTGISPSSMVDVRRAIRTLRSVSSGTDGPPSSTEQASRPHPTRRRRR